MPLLRRLTTLFQVLPVKNGIGIACVRFSILVARLIRTAPKKEGGIGATSFSPQDYIDRASIYLEKNGFSEKEIARGTEQWGNIL